VEVDGGYHGRGFAQRADARRDRDLARLGYRVLRVRDADVVQRHEAVLRLIRVALALQAS